MATGIAVERIDASERRIARPPASVSIAPPGHAVSVSWNPVAGATKAEVTRAALTIYPAVAEETHADATMRADGAGWSIDVPAKRRVKALALVGLKQPGGDVLTGGLPGGMRLTVAFPQVQGGGFDTPRFAVPQVGRDNAVPPTLTGASFSSGVLQMTPATAASRVRVALVTGDNPSSFADQATELTRVNLTTHAAARNAKVTGPDGTVVWEVPEFDPDAEPADIDLRHVLEAALTPQVAGGGPLQAAFTITADAPARASVSFGGASGFLVRVEDGVVRTVLEGDPVEPAFADFAAETPNGATGDLTVRYEGVRILETVSDAIPAGPKGPALQGSQGPALQGSQGPALHAVSGVIVGPAEAVRALPPHALDGHSPARIGIYGRAPEACELAVEFVATSGEVAGAALAPPAVLVIEPGGELRTHWAVLPEDAALTGASGVRVRANSGRFFWAFNQDGAPIVRVAVFDPDPGGRPLFLGPTRLIDVGAIESHQPSFAFPAAVLRGAVPRLASDLFLTVDISDLSVRYAR